MTPRSRPSLATASGVPPDLAIASAIALISRTVSALTLGRRACTAPPAATAASGGFRLDRPFSAPGRADLDTAHARLGAERNEAGLHVGELAAADAVLLLGQHDDRAPLRRLVGTRCQLGGVRQCLLGHAAQRLELVRLTIAERDRPGLVEQ